MKKARLMLVGLIFTMFFVTMIAGNALAGGGPGPTCYTSWSPWVPQGELGETLSLEVYNGSCPATFTVDWDDGDASNDVVMPIDDLNAVSWQYLDIPDNIANNRAYTFSVVASNGSEEDDFSDMGEIIVGDFSLTKPQLVLGWEGAFWESMFAYQQRMLTVDFSLSNVGSGGAYMVTLEETQFTNGAVSALDSYPLTIPKVMPGQSVSVRRVHVIPMGVASYKTLFYTTANDAGGNGHTYGSKPHGA